MDENFLVGMTSNEDKRTSLKEIFSYVFQLENIEQKTILSNDNISAIIKMTAVNEHLERYFDFRIELYDKLIEQKRLNVISLYGQGRRDILNIVKSMQTQINADMQEKKGLF